MHVSLRSNLELNEVMILCRYYRNDFSKMSIRSFEKWIGVTSKVEEFERGALPGFDIDSYDYEWMRQLAIHILAKLNEMNFKNVKDRVLIEK